MDVISEVNSQALSYEDDQFLDKLEQKYNQEIKTKYDQALKKLGIFDKIYLWMRRNFVQDLFFRKSEEHLQDIVEQLESGRTSVKSKMELRLLD